jgi:glycosyltransferase involved in cell wall biosynthesis
VFLHTTTAVNPSHTTTAGNGRRQAPSVAFLLETGVANQFWATAVEKVANAGFNTTFVSVQGPGPLHQHLAAAGVRTLALSAAGVKDYPRVAARLGRFLQKERVDVLHSCAPIQATVGGMGCVLSPKTVHAFQRQHMQINSRQQELFTAIGTRLSDYTLAISEATAKWATTEDHVPASKVRIAHLGIPRHREVSAAEVAGIKAELGIPDDAHTIVMAGYLRVEKGHRVLLEALPAIRSGLKRPVHVVFVGGSGPEEEAIMALCADDPAIHPMGFQKDLASWFALADVVVMPSLFEAFGLVAVETFAACRPLVASDVGGLREVVDQDSGLLVPPGEPRALAHAVVEVLSSPAKARAMAAAGYERFERRFTVDAMVGGWARFYEDAVGRSAAHRRVATPVRPRTVHVGRLVHRRVGSLTPAR